jgi:sugar O-acyltransferase (sialic acid O-acetyltransferase NeuD family)
MAINSKIIVIGVRPDGHGNVALQIASQIPGIVILGFLDDSSSPTELFGIPRLGGSEAWPNYLLSGNLLFHVAIGHNPTRRKIANQILQKGGRLVSLVHPHAMIYPSAQLGTGCFVGAGAVVCPGVTVGVNCIINHGAILEHDCQVGNHVNVSTGFVTGGRVKLEEGVFAGIGAQVKPDVTVRRWTYLAAGAVVIQDTKPHSLYVGVPARHTRDLGTDADPQTP